MTTRELKPTRPQPACPECEKLAAASEKHRIIMEFLEWADAKDVYLLDDNNYPVDHHKFVVEYFEIDLDKVERERRALLEWLQEQHNDSE